MEPARTRPRQINPPGPLYQQVEERATAEGTDPTAVILRFLTAYADGTLPTPQLLVAFPAGTTAVPDPESLKYDQQRLVKTRLTSFRVEDSIWQAAQARAKTEQLPLSAVMNRFLRGYAEHLITP